MDKQASTGGYEPPTLITLGTVHALTQQKTDKTFGHADGLTFQGASITWSS